MPGCCTLMLLFMLPLVTLCRQGGEQQGQSSKDNRLNKSNERLEPEEHNSNEQWCQEEKGEEDHFTGEHVAQQPEGEADESRDLADRLQDSNDESDGTAFDI